MPLLCFSYSVLINIICINKNDCFLITSKTEHIPTNFPSKKKRSRRSLITPVTTFPAKSHKDEMLEDPEQRGKGKEFAAEDHER